MPTVIRCPEAPLLWVIPIHAGLYLQGKLNLDDPISKKINLGEINEADKERKGGAIARSVITSF